jgi:hypothetical protein
MISRREVDILTHVIEKHSGSAVPPDAAVEALYALAEYSYRRTGPDRNKKPNISLETVQLELSDTCAPPTAR